MINRIYILYLLSLIFLSFFSYFFVDLNLIYLKPIFPGFIYSHRIFASLLYVSIIVSVFLCYLLLICSKKISYTNMVSLLTLSIVFLLLAYPAMLSYDIFNYILSAKIAFFYKENPYVIMPIEFSQEPFLAFTRAANKTLLYGPSWISLTAIPYVLGLGNFLLTVFYFKLLVTFFYLGTTSLIWKISKNVTSTLIFAINPLILIETILSGHNDIVMMFFALLSYYVLGKKKIFLAFIFLFISIAIKFATIVLLPIELFIIWKILQKRSIDWENVYSFSFLAMIGVLLMAPLREEVYPWYGVWFLTFVPFLTKKKYLLHFSIAISLGLMLSYLPYMLSGTYAGLTPYLKTVLIIFPSFLLFFYLIVFKKLWNTKKSFFLF